MIPTRGHRGRPLQVQKRRPKDCNSLDFTRIIQSGASTYCIDSIATRLACTFCSSGNTCTCGSCRRWIRSRCCSRSEGMKAGYRRCHSTAGVLSRQRNTSAELTNTISLLLQELGESACASQCRGICLQAMSIVRANGEVLRRQFCASAHICRRYCWSLDIGEVSL